MLIRLDRNYDYPDINRQTPKNDGHWNNIELTEEKINNCDVYVVFNSPEIFDYKITCRKGGRILILQEPPYGGRPHLLKNKDDFDIIISHVDSINEKNIRQPAMLPWLVDMDYSSLKSFNFKNINKKNEVVWVTSNRRVNPGHDGRLNFLDLLNQKAHPDIHIYGKGINPIDNKFNVLVGAKYSIAIENYSDKDYWTEKIMDAYLSLTLPFYYGCQNLEDYFPKNSFVYIDINKPNYAYDKICDILSNGYFESYKDDIIEARNRVLDKYQFFPWIKEFINSKITLGEKETFSFYRTAKESFIQRIKNKLSL